MNFYYDTEFLEGTQARSFLGIPLRPSKPTIDLISIAIVAEDGREYYGVSKDFNLKEAWNRADKPGVYWIRENVLRPIFNELDAIAQKDREFCEGRFFTVNSGFTYSYFESLIQFYGSTNKEIAEEVEQFIRGEYPIDHSAAKAVFGENASAKIKVFDISKPETPIVLWGYYADYDHVAFCWLFGKMMNLPDDFPMYTRDLKQALDALPMTIQERGQNGRFTSKVVKIENWKEHPDYPKQTNEHNALADARWNKKLHEFIESVS